jgi:protein phosphatase PTC6
MILFSDGVSSVVSDDEIAGLARYAPTPREAAKRIVAYAEDVGARDNSTALVVPLAGWGKVRGPDATSELRAFRRANGMRTCCLFPTTPSFLC